MWMTHLCTENLWQRMVSQIHQYHKFMQIVYIGWNKTGWFHSFSLHHTTTVYRKATHTEWYLQWDSHHNITAKYSVDNTLTHRAKTVCSTHQLLQKEEEHLREALKKYKHPNWALIRVKIKNNMHKKPLNNNIKTVQYQQRARRYNYWSHKPKASVKASKTSIANIRYAGRF